MQSHLNGSEAYVFQGMSFTYMLSTVNLLIAIFAGRTLAHQHTSGTRSNQQRQTTPPQTTTPKPYRTATSAPTPNGQAAPAHQTVTRTPATAPDGHVNAYARATQPQQRQHQMATSSPCPRSSNLISSAVRISSSNDHLTYLTEYWGYSECSCTLVI